MWFLRLAWLLLPISMVPLVSAAAHGDTLRITLTIALWACWAAGLLAALVPSTVSLTVGRMIAPVGVVTVVLSGIAGAAAWKVVIAAAVAIVALLLWFSAETGVACAQGSAYGDEQRFPLKAPVPLLVPMIITWLACAATACAGVLLLGGRQWVGGGVCLVVAGFAAWFAGPRFHQLSRRWVVIVPVGLVLHDPTLLAENALFRTSQLAGLRLAPAGSQAADLTGGTAGAPLEISLTELDTITKARTRAQPAGTALHVLSALVSPSRPGKVLAAAAARHLPVG